MVYQIGIGATVLKGLLLTSGVKWGAEVNVS